MRKLLIVILLILIFASSGCWENYPSVKIDQSRTSSYVQIDVGNPYVYKGFETIENDGKKDLILHFEAKNERP